MRRLSVQLSSSCAGVLALLLRVSYAYQTLNENEVVRKDGGHTAQYAKTVTQHNFADAEATEASSSQETQRTSFVISAHGDMTKASDAHDTNENKDRELFLKVNHKGALLRRAAMEADDDHEMAVIVGAQGPSLEEADAPAAAATDAEAAPASEGVAGGAEAVPDTEAAAEVAAAADAEAAQETDATAATAEDAESLEADAETGVVVEEEAEPVAAEAAAAAEAVFCADGVASARYFVCCAASCGSCGGTGCGDRPGGNKKCCGGSITAAGTVCSGPSDVGCVIPDTKEQHKLQDGINAEPDKSGSTAAPPPTADKTCTESTMTGHNMNPSPKSSAPPINGHCFYVAVGKQNCNEFCARGFPGATGKCSALGTAHAAKSIKACEEVLASLGVTATGSELNLNSASSLGCSYLEKMVAGTEHKKVLLNKLSEAKSPVCDEAPFDSKEHRVCACEDVSDHPAPDATYQLVVGDTIRVVGIVQDLVPFSISVASDAFKLEGDPIEKQMHRSYKKDGKWSTKQLANMWPFHRPGEAYSLDITMTDTLWEVAIWGTHYAALDLPRSDVTVTGSKVDVVGLKSSKVSLFNKEVPDTSILRSMDSVNGCLQDDVQITGDTVTFNFVLVPAAITGVTCLRCEKEVFEHGTNIYLENGQISLSVEGNLPRVQTFLRKFAIGSEVPIAISYVKEDSVVELYVNSERLEILYYSQAQPLTMGPGGLGCAGTEDPKLHKAFSGQIKNFNSLPDHPQYRPLTAPCSTIVCPSPQMKHKANAATENCPGSICLETDQTLCCDNMPRCNPALQCSQKHEYLHNASDIYCEGLQVGDACEDTPQDHCCVPEGQCDTFPCGAGRVLYANASSLFCNETTCGDKDIETCCLEANHCSSYNCEQHPNMAPRLANKDEICTGSDGDPACTIVDLDTCCTDKGTCESYDCPKLYIQIAAAAERNCGSFDCDSDAFMKCCAHQSRCSSFKCEEKKKVLKEDAEDIFCSAEICPAADEERCCEDRPTCNTMQCPSTHVHVFNREFVHCKGANCTVTDDLHRCCGAKGFCSSFKCSTKTTNMAALNGHAHEILCDDANCSATPWEKCCSVHGLCSTYRCPEFYVPKLNASVINCVGDNCSDPSDLFLCCDDVAPCSDWQCPSDLAQVSEKHSIFCEDRECKKSDEANCCTKKGSCTSYHCPDNTHPRMNAAVLLCHSEHCNTTSWQKCCAAPNSCSTFTCPVAYEHQEGYKDLTCSGWACTLSDRDNCCIEAASCSAYSCPKDYFRAKNAAFLFCKGADCSREDLHTCCRLEGSCHGYTCPKKWLHKPAAGQILCNEKDCNPQTTAHTKCCAEAGKCNSFQCAIGAIHVNGAAKESCKEWLCQDDDASTCCKQVAMCSAHTCPDGYVLNALHADILCADRACADADHDACCVPQGHCFSYECPANYLHKRDVNLLCRDENCTSTDYTHCCAEEGLCNTHQCDVGFLHRDGAETRECSGFKCGETDRDTCCRTEATCGAFSCPVGTAQKHNAAKVSCGAATCSDDNKMDCCGPEARCDTYECPPGFLNRHNSAELFCNAESCTETDYMQCCVEEGHCHSHTCPEEEYVHRKNASETFCMTPWRCTLQDTDRCCDRRATCFDATCPGAEVKRLKAEEIKCASRDCNMKANPLTGLTEFDDSTCCNEDGPCLKLTCPKGFQHKPDAGSLLCADDVCEDTNFNHCCQAQDYCHSYSCPERFLPRWNADTIKCAGFICHDGDQDTCCEHRAHCNEHICTVNLDLVLKLDAHVRLCQNTTCEAQVDDNECCDNEGTCLRKECDIHNVHKTDAANLPCSDARCLDTDEAKCCEEKAQCLMHTCPEGMAQVDAVEPLYCAGLQCVASDTENCCATFAICSTYAPPIGYFLKHTANVTTCNSSICTDLDLHACAAEEGFCSSFLCPRTEVLKARAHEIPCQDLDCVNTAYDHCCDQERSCSTYWCPDSHVHVPNAELLRCQDKVCTKELDETKCCQEAATCNTLDCPTNFVRRTTAAHIYCQGIDCDQTEDLHNCCVEDGKCASLECPAGYLHKHNAHEIGCADATCFNQDYHQCCDEMDECPTYKCPPDHMIHKHMYEAIQCREDVCTAADKHICCDRRQSCSTFSCTAFTAWGYKRIDDYEDRYCDNRTCVVSDKDTCCERAGGPIAVPETVVIEDRQIAATEAPHIEEQMGAHQMGLSFIVLVMTVGGLLR